MLSKSKKLTPLNIGDIHRILQQEESEFDKKEKVYQNILYLQQWTSVEKQFVDIEESNHVDLGVLACLAQSTLKILNQMNCNPSNSNQENDFTPEQILTQVEQYYSSNSESELVIVNKELGLLKVEETSLLSQKINNFEIQRKILERSLFSNILTNKDKYFDCLNTLEGCQVRSDQLNLLVHQSRNHLKVLKSDVINKSKEIYLKLSKVQNLQKTIARLKWIQNTVYPVQQYLQSETLQAIPLLEQLKLVTVEQYYSLEILQSKNYYNDKLALFQSKMNEIFRQNLSNFNEVSFLNFLESFITMEERCLITPFNVLVPKLQIQFVKQITLRIVSRIEDTQTESEIKYDGSDVIKVKLQDRIKKIQNEFIPELIRTLYHQYIQLMVSIHLMIRSLQETTYWQDQLNNRKILWKKINSTLVKIWNSCDELVLQPLDDALLVLGYTSLFTNFCYQFTGSKSTNLRDIVKARFQHYIDEQHILRYKSLQTQIEKDQFEPMTVSADKNFNLIQRTVKMIEKLNPDNPIGILFKPDLDEVVLTQSFQNMFHQDQTTKLKHIILGDLGIQSLKSQTTYFLNGKVRNIQLCLSGFLVLEDISFYLSIIGYQNEPILQGKQLQFLDLFIISGLIMMTHDVTLKLLLENTNTINVKFDEKVDFDYFTNQFDYVSEVLIFQTKYQALKNFIDSNQINLQNLISEAIITKRSPQVELKQRIIYIETLRFIISQLDEASNTAICSILKPQIERYQVITQQITEIIIQSYFQGLKFDSHLQGLVLTKWDQKMGEKDVQQRASSLERITQFAKETCDKIKQSFDVQTMNDFTPMISDFFINIIFDLFSKVRKVNSSGREQMISDYMVFIKSLDGLASNVDTKNQHEQFLKIFNSMQADAILEYIYASQKQWTFKQLMNLLNYAPALLSIKKTQKRETILKMFKYYQELILLKEQS